MADFQDVISELKKVNVRINISNLKMDRLIAASDPRGAAAAEDKADQQRGQAQQINLLQAIRFIIRIRWCWWRWAYAA